MLQDYLDPKTLKILGDNSDAKKKAKETKSEADKVPKEKKTTYTADASGAKKGAEEAQKAVNSVEDEHVTQIKTQYGIGKNGKVSQKSTNNQALQVVKLANKARPTLLQVSQILLL